MTNWAPKFELISYAEHFERERDVCVEQAQKVRGSFADGRLRSEFWSGRAVGMQRAAEHMRMMAKERV